MKSRMIQKLVTCMCVLSLVLVSAFVTHVRADSPPGVDAEGVGLSEVEMGSIVPIVTETGLISLSVDGLGVYPSSSGTIQVEKPAGATVRSAYFAAASTGFRRYTVPNGHISIDGVGFSWNIVTPSSISSYNHWADVTSIVKPKIDAAPAGRVDFTITEVNTARIDGEILAVIFDDPNQTTDNTIVLLFGAQNVNGDTFAIGVAEPIDLSDPNLVLDLSLGISYGAQGCSSGQYSRVDVNGTRLTTSAGGEDDGVCANGALLTVGGLDDSNANPPNPFATANWDPRQDDELYDLIPFVSDGDISINVFTINPSNDDNIYFAALFLASTTAVVGEGILLAPVSAENPVGSPHTVTATVQDDDGNPVVGREVTFTVLSGPHAGSNGTDTTDANGEATFAYVGTLAGIDVIEASFVDSQGDTVYSNQVTKEWLAFAELWAVEYRWGSYSFADWPIFEGSMEVRIENRGPGDAFNVTAEVMSWPANTTVPDPNVTVGNIPAGGSAWSGDTFTTRVDMANPVGMCEEVFWRIEYDDVVGVHHVVENVPEFPPGEGPPPCP